MHGGINKKYCPVSDSSSVQQESEKTKKERKKKETRKFSLSLSLLQTHTHTYNGKGETCFILLRSPRRVICTNEHGKERQKPYKIYKLQK
jgi:hypothetical protein